MAGDWLKVEVSTPDKAEIFSIAEKCKIPPTDALGRLILVWRWFDQHTENGDAGSVTDMFIDHLAGVAGFAQAMRDQHWLGGDASHAVLPNFDRHNGKTAKTRALTAKRNDAYRRRNANAGVTQDVSPREVKRSKDITPPYPPQGGVSAKASRKAKDQPIPGWWESEAGTIAEGARQGKPARVGESMADYRGRLRLG